jgi:hypothetical protein
MERAIRSVALHRGAGLGSLSPQALYASHLLRRHCGGGTWGRIRVCRCLLKWKVQYACLFQVKFAFYAPTRLIGDLAVAQQPVDVFSLSGNKFRS